MKQLSLSSGSLKLWLLVLSYFAVFGFGVLFHKLSLEAFEHRRLLFSEAEFNNVMQLLNTWYALGGVVLIGLVFLISRTRTKLVIVLGALGFVYTLSWGIWLVADMMTGVGINQSVAYHLVSGTEGADYSQFWKEIIVASSFLALAVIILLFSMSVGWKNRRRGYQTIAATRTRHVGISNTLVPLSLGCLLVSAGWLVSPWHDDILALTSSYSRLDNADEQRLQALYNVEPRAISNDKNLLVLYLESVESTYFDEALFPGLLPNLRRHRDASTYFSGIEQTPGAGWTIAGLVNTQCGVPLVTPGPGGNDMGRVQQFLPKAKCLAEHLVDNGFRTVYMGGAEGEFAGKSRFLQQHGFAVVRDKAYFQSRQGDSEDKFSGWGAYDDHLLDSVYDEFVTLSKKDEPFALFALTMDTHHPHGHISPSCSGLEYGDGDIKTLNALRCADQLVSRFIEQVRTSPHYENTTLVVLSDHLAMANDAKELIDQAEKRENLMMVFDDAMGAGEQHVQGTMMDVGATLLDLLGADETRLGFGRSLLEPHDGNTRDGENNAYSRDYYASGSVAEYLSFSSGLWDMPSVVGQIRSDGNGGILLGDNQLEAPFFSVLDSQNKVVELYFYDFAQRIEELKEGARYLYALECEESRNAIGGVCLVTGLKGVGEKVFTSSELIEGIRAAEIF